MKRILLFIIIVLVLLSPRLFWSFKQAKQLDIVVIDKTVPKKDYREHNGLFTVLESKKVVKKDGELYDIGKDYYGYDPYDQKSFPPYNEKGKKDLIYVADTYGVYSDDLKEKPDGKRSKLIYGGMNLLEWNQLMGSKGENSTLIAEFNSFASPTDEITSDVMQKNLHVDWNGWIGRYFIDLASDEIPPWLIKNYEKQYKRDWKFKGNGVAFIDQSDRVVVLDKSSLSGYVMFNLTEQGEKKFSKVESSNYMYWFDIVQPISGSEVLANYKLALTDKGKKQLNEAGLPTVFPAIIHLKKDKTYYFAGDYADYAKSSFNKWDGLGFFKKLMAKEEDKFYRNTYVPLMGEILDEINRQKER